MFQNNEARLSIQCPRCRKLVSRNAERCYNCGLPRPGLFYRFPALVALMRGNFSSVDAIIAVCFAMYVVSMLMNLEALFTPGDMFSMLGPSGEALYRLGMGGAIPWMQGRWWTLITATFLHGGILHIAFNMIWLKRLGPWVEELFGPSRFWLIYIVSGISGSAASTLAGTYYFVGASGAIFGLYGALIYYGRARGGTFGSALFRQMLIWAGIGFLFGLAMPGVDNWGHLGGFLGGLATAFLLSYQERQREGFFHHLLALAVLLLVLASFGLMMVGAITG